MKVLKTILVVAFVLTAGLAFAQDAPTDPGPILEWEILLAGLLNGVVIVALVQIVKRFGPGLKQANPLLLQIVVLAAGVGLPYLTQYLGDFLGHPVDFNPIMVALNGLGTTAIATMEFNALKAMLPGVMNALEKKSA